MLVVRPQPGQAETWGRNERRPIDWRTCCATSTSRSRGAPGSGVSETRMVSPIPSLSRMASPAVEAMMPLSPMPASVRPEMERVVAARGEQPVDVDQVAHAADLGADDDPVVAQAGLLGELGRAQRALEHRLDHHVARVARLGQAGVLVHQLGQDGLVERAPVDPDADRLVVVDGDLDDRREVLVVALGADVARIDPVLGQQGGRLGVVDQQLVPVVVEVADDRHVDAEAADLADHLGHGRGGLIGVDRDPDQLRAGMRQPCDLDGGAIRIGRVRVGHRLDDDRMGAADEDATDVDRDGARRTGLTEVVIPERYPPTAERARWSASAGGS